MASAISFVGADFRLSPLRMGEVLTAFFVGYARQPMATVNIDRINTGDVSQWR
jgi:hypothetical protein